MMRVLHEFSPNAGSVENTDWTLLSAGLHQLATGWCEKIAVQENQHLLVREVFACPMEGVHHYTVAFSRKAQLDPGLWLLDLLV